MRGAYTRAAVAALMVVACAEGQGGREASGGSEGLAMTTGDASTNTNGSNVSTTSDPSTEDTASPASSDGTPPDDAGDPECGNGVVEEGEQCDLGPNNADDAACTTACEDAVCGDGLLFPDDEACDDGNADETDACTSLCAAPSCDDRITSGNESDVDCGGDCAPCVAGGLCNGDDDCLNQACSGGLCAPAASCAELLLLHPDLADGVYTIDPNGESTADAVDAYCDMSTDGGGWTALAANGDISIAETADPLDCYPLISNDSGAGCGPSGDMLGDFTVPGTQQGALSWRYLLAVVYGDEGYADKLAFFAVDFGGSQPTADERFNGIAYVPTGITTKHGQIACDGLQIVHYTMSGTYNPSGIADGKGTIFGHDSVITMNDSTRRTFGFTDTAEASATQQAVGVDDYQDGWSCSDLWGPQEIRGQRMAVLVR